MDQHADSGDERIDLYGAAIIEIPKSDPDAYVHRGGNSEQKQEGHSVLTLDSRDSNEHISSDRDGADGNHASAASGVFSELLERFAG